MTEEIQGHGQSQGRNRNNQIQSGAGASASANDSMKINMGNQNREMLELDLHILQRIVSVNEDDEVTAVELIDGDHDHCHEHDIDLDINPCEDRNHGHGHGHGRGEEVDSECEREIKPNVITPMTSTLLASSSSSTLPSTSRKASLAELDKSKKVWLVERYCHYKNTGHVIKEWKKEFPGIKPPHRSTILRLLKKFQEYGSIERKKYIRNNPVRTAANIARVKEYFEANPNMSTRKAAPILDIERTTLRRVLSDLKKSKSAGARNAVRKKKEITKGKGPAVISSAVSSSPPPPQQEHAPSPSPVPLPAPVLVSVPDLVLPVAEVIEVNPHPNLNSSPNPLLTSMKNLPTISISSSCSSSAALSMSMQMSNEMNP